MRMFSNSEYLGVLLTFLILNTAVSLPTKEKVGCEVLSDFYPSNLRVTEILQICKTTKLVEPFLSYCDELVRVRNNVSSCGLGQLLQHVPDNMRKDIVSMSLAAPVTKPICNVFEKLNATLYRLYLDKPGIGKQLSTRTFCPLFCERYEDYCELLFRTYWIKNILVDFSQGIQGKTTADNSGIPGKGSADNSGIPGKGSADNSGILGKGSADNSGISGKGLVGNSDVVLVSSTTATLSKETKHEQDAAKKATSLPATKAKQTTIGENKHKPGIEHITPNVSVGKSKSPEIAVGTSILSNQDLQSDKGIATAPIGNDKDITATNNEKSKLNEFPVGKKPIDNNNNNNDQSPDEELIVKVKDENKNDGETRGQPNAITVQKQDKKADDSINIDGHIPLGDPDRKQDGKADESINVDGHIPFDPDRGISDDVAPTIEKGTEFGNQIHDFGDGYGEQANEYQDNSQDGPEAPLPVETAQTDFKDNIVDNNLQSDEASVGKQTNNVPQLPAYPEEEDGHFFAYFLTIVVFCIAGYLVFHNKQKIIALIIEGRHERRRRPNNGAYKRLDSKDNAKATSHVIF